MIRSVTLNENYKVRLEDAEGRSLIADATADKGGAGQGMRPHDLLEAALAACVSMYVKMYADSHGVPLRRARSRVSLDRSRVGAPRFVYALELEGELSEEQRRRLLDVARACPVRRTLSQPIAFELLSE